jgi:hypothetical protein
MRTACVCLASSSRWTAFLGAALRAALDVALALDA